MGLPMQRGVDKAEITVFGPVFNSECLAIVLDGVRG